MFVDQFKASSTLYVSLSGGTGSPPTSSTASGQCTLLLSLDNTHGLASCNLIGTLVGYRQPAGSFVKLLARLFVYMV